MTSSTNFASGRRAGILRLYAGESTSLMELGSQLVTLPKIFRDVCKWARVALISKQASKVAPSAMYWWSRGEGPAKQASI
jgi:hypothetical protein